MRHKLKEHHLDIEVDSAGTGGWHVGECPDKRAIAIAKKKGVDISNLKARKFCHDDFDAFDKIFVMDLENRMNVLDIARDEKAKQKVDLLLNMHKPDSNAEVPDPWFGGTQDFEEVYELLNDACDSFIKTLKE